MLKMKPCCERCNGSLGLTDTAFICSYECTFCSTCTESMAHICPNCAGELVLRPKRAKKPTQVVADQLKKKVTRLLPGK
ncbi:MAG: DUF1272 domain-containing protein [Hahellaceae bacterium]|nr:DUF1272 domain-containing protein [Hahellaceae bacterium]MCP5168175.1 DUF1272 domain-containing protein [Hahellaceae bacterium]